jgi:hypothetical protein
MSDALVKRLRCPPFGTESSERNLMEEAAARIAELEAALRDVLPYVDTCNSSHREAQAKGYAALEGGK